ncbi:large ribosomal subunit protein bL9m [Anabrus simplex]|uniref:large ribosomal subunit protein bL9m n=1 Tax=Anabrus simplex TaxID=316456 RepID=UPI0035A3371D
MLRQLFGRNKCFMRTTQLQFEVLSFIVLPQVQQSRNTFILKRRIPPALHKKGQAPKKLKARHFVYDLVEDTNSRKKENLELVLTDYVQGLGERGDKVSVRPNYGYHKLLLPGLAVYASPENIAKYGSEEERSKKPSRHSSHTAERTVNVLSRNILAVVMNKETPWKIEPWHIRASFRKAGFYVPEEAIELPQEPIEGPDLDLEMKEFTVTVTINNHETAKVRCRIHHWSTNLADRLPFVEDHWKIPADPLFPPSS